VPYFQTNVRYACAIINDPMIFLYDYSTTENLCFYMFHSIENALAHCLCNETRLASVVIYETDKNRFEYCGEQ
jgi:hypothetical protein